MNCDNGWHHGAVGSGWWLLMALMMLVFWGGLVWLIVTLIRNGPVHRHVLPSPASSPQLERPDPEAILHERFARGEIDVEEYHQRVDALRARRRSPS